MSEPKKCPWCESRPPHSECFGRADGNESASCARLVMYETAKLPAAPIIYTHAVEGEVVPKKDYDELCVYASRLAVNLMLLNGIITRAARDAQKYVDEAERSLS